MVIKLKDHVVPSTGLKIELRNAVFDIKKLSSEAKRWLEMKQYDFTEKKHSDKDLPQGHEVDLAFDNDRKIDEYIKFHIDVRIFALNVKKIKIDGKTMEKGYIEIKFLAYLELDYRKKWQSNPITNFLLHAYNNYIIKQRILDYEDKLYGELMTLVNKLRKTIGTYG